MTEYILPFHILSLLFTLYWIFRAEKDGLAWFRGKIQTIEHSEMHRLHRYVWIGLLSLIATGFVMFWPGRAYHLSNPTFLVKMGFVGALIINSFVIDRFLKVASEQSFAQLSKAKKIGLFASAAVSGICWIGAITMGFML